MEDQHEWFEELAVGHVLGGLPAGDAAEFRSHLLSCQDCRARVSELRDIAADLAAAERDERARSRLRTETPRRVEQEDGERSAGGQRITVRHVTVAAIVVFLLAGAMAFWNLHLRTTATAFGAVAEQRGDILEHLATAVELDAELASGLAGQVATDGERVTLNLTGVPDIPVGERLVAWLVDGPDGSPVAALLVRSGQLENGNLAATFDEQGAALLVLTRERGEPGIGPSGEELVRARLSVD